MTSFKSGSLRELMEMLTFCRPHNSRKEQEFVDKFITPLAPKRDDFGNHYLWIDGLPIIWSCHTDTVHAIGGRQNIVRNNNIVEIKNKKAGRCLGADDAAGCWILLEMIRAHIPGLYLFHRGEEKGGLGSKFFATQYEYILEKFQFAIAFDRRGKDSVITHQLGQRCCSQDFALDFAKRLGMDYKPDSTGMFTDTANYMDIIPECTNISVGYEREHGPTETIDLHHIRRVRDAMVTMDFGGLKAYRDPKAIEMEEYSYGPFDIKEYADILDLVEEYPNLAAILLSEAGYTEADFIKLLCDETQGSLT